MTNLAWQIDAACRNLPTEWWYSEEADVIKRAQAICRTCPVKKDCLEWGLAFEQWGIWGGTTQKHRVRLRRERGILLTTPQAWGGREIPHNCGTEAGYQYLLRRAEPDAPKGKKVTCQDCLAAHRRKTADQYQYRAKEGARTQKIAAEMKRMGLVRKRNVGWLDADGRLLSAAELKAIRKNIKENPCP